MAFGGLLQCAAAIAVNRSCAVPGPMLLCEVWRWLGLELAAEPCVWRWRAAAKGAPLAPADPINICQTHHKHQYVIDALPRSCQVFGLPGAGVGYP